MLRSAAFADSVVAVLKAVLDTNVVISAHLKGEGREALILGLALAGQFQMVVSETILAEYEEVLRRPRFDLDLQRIRDSIKAIRKAAILVEPRKHVQETRDPDDNKMLECALEAGAHYVVTGNVRHFPFRFRSIRIVLPRQFLTILAAELS